MPPDCSGCRKTSTVDISHFMGASYHAWKREDAYGIPTGYWCSACYNDPKMYTYRKDSYFDAGYAGENLEPEDY